MKVAALLEAHESAKQAALRFQQELIDAGADDVTLVTPNKRILKAAIYENGASGVDGSVALRCNDHDLLLSYRAGPAKYSLYHVYTDNWFTDAAEALDNLKTWVANGALKEDVEPSPSTKLARFAKELQAHGFDAEVTNKAPTGVINGSKLGIEVSGYGMKDFIKLYRPLWKWEDDAGYFADVKHEQRFRSVRELVDKLQQFYRRLPKCFDYKAPAR